MRSVPCTWCKAPSLSILALRLQIQNFDRTHHFRFLTSKFQKSAQTQPNRTDLSRMATVEFDEDEWEPFNDDGFICKRKKRPRLDPTTTSSSAPPPPDPAAEERNRRERKKRALIKLRDKYQKEIDQWEHLSNTLKTLQDKALTTQQQVQWNEEETSASCDLAMALHQSPEISGRRLLDDLIVQAEAEEEIIRDVSNLCDMAEAICCQQGEHTTQSLVDLPVWGSPRELMASLCDD